MSATFATYLFMNGSRFEKSIKLNFYKYDESVTVGSFISSSMRYLDELACMSELPSLFFRYNSI